MTKQNHCIWNLTNQNSLYFCVNQWLYMWDINSCNLVQRPSTITILYMIIGQKYSTTVTNQINSWCCFMKTEKSKWSHTWEHRILCIEMPPQFSWNQINKCHINSEQIINTRWVILNISYQSQLMQSQLWYTNYLLTWEIFDRRSRVWLSQIHDHIWDVRLVTQQVVQNFT